MLKPGQYRIIELASKCGVSRTTAEKFIQRYELPETLVPYNGREVAGVELTDEKIAQISKDYPRVLQGDDVDIALGSDTHVQSYEADNNTLIEELRNRIKTLEDENSQILKDVADKRVELAILKGDLQRQSDLVDHFEARLKDKEAIIETLRKESEAQKSRADALNNQIAGSNSMIQYSKGAVAQFEELKKMIQEQAARTVIEVNEPVESPKKGFRLFGFEISKAPSRWEGIPTQRRVRKSRQRPYYY